MTIFSSKAIASIKISLGVRCYNMKKLHLCLLKFKLPNLISDYLLKEVFQPSSVISDFTIFMAYTNGRMNDVTNQSTQSIDVQLPKHKVYLTYSPVMKVRKGEGEEKLVGGIYKNNIDLTGFDFICSAP